MTITPQTKKALIWSGIGLALLACAIGYNAYQKKQQAKQTGDVGAGEGTGKPIVADFVKRPVVAGGGIKINPALLAMRCKSVDTMSRTQLFQFLGIPYKPATGSMPDKVVKDMLKQKWGC